MIRSTTITEGDTGKPQALAFPAEYQQTDLIASRSQRTTYRSGCIQLLKVRCGKLVGFSFAELTSLRHASVRIFTIPLFMDALGYRPLGSRLVALLLI